MYVQTVGADSISAFLYGFSGAYGMLPYCIKFRFGSCADLREHQGTPLQQRESFLIVYASNYVQFVCYIEPPLLAVRVKGASHFCAAGGRKSKNDECAAVEIM